MADDRRQKKRIALAAIKLPVMVSEACPELGEGSNHVISRRQLEI
ncbi:MAG: hypothetical protein WBD36_02450 [Bacteroidota bacterium]